MIEIIDRPLHMVAEDSLGSDEGLAARAAGVTASEIHAIAVGGRGTWRRILDDKLNGSKFRGNQHTKRGHEREPFLLAWACSNIALCAANVALFSHPDKTSILATPDGHGFDSSRGEFGVECKSHDYGWGDRDDIPADHYDQMQLGMFVTETRWWLYVWEVMGEDGTPTLDAPRYRWVERDDARIAKLLKEADAFMTWRAAGAPVADDDLPADVDEALAIVADARAAMAPHKKAEATALETIRVYASQEADEHGKKAAGTRAGFTFSITSTDVLDEDAWESAEPNTYREWADMVRRANEVRAMAMRLYTRKKASGRLTVTETKDAA
ncbi:YqaJ viral recombinase family protein [Microbacterium sp. 22303]|uniref:YqaJ viral recombinase family protein n=1 Tax=Microbacterium sp. 22303 TaxID=3453905 RepID=UPI003F85A499